MNSPVSPTINSVSISWFVDLRTLLSSYINVLRYELNEQGSSETVEALIHGEILKILRRKLPASSVVSEYPIGHHFSKLKVKAQTPDTADRETKRRFRSDIAIFRPWESYSETPDWKEQNVSRDQRQPIAIIEIKRDGTPTEILDDIYRLAVCSAKTEAIGYFILGGPMEKLVRLKKSVALLKDLGISDLQPFQYSDFSSSSIYDENDVSPDKQFWIREYPLVASIEIPKIRSDVTVLPKLPEKPALQDNGRDFCFFIFGISPNKDRVDQDTNQRFNICISEAPPLTGKMGLPVCTEEDEQACVK